MRRARAATPASVPRRCAGVLALACLLVGLSGSAAYAVPTDVNPNASDNSDPNASTGGRANHMATSPGQQRHLLPGGRVRRDLQDHRRRRQLEPPQRPSAGHGVGRRGQAHRREPRRRQLLVRRAGRPAVRHPGQHGRRRELDAPRDVVAQPGARGHGQRQHAAAGFSCATPPHAWSRRASGSRSWATTIAVGTNCGVALSTNNGSTWNFVDPTPATPANKVWDILCSRATSSTLRQRRPPSAAPTTARPGPTTRSRVSDGPLLDRRLARRGRRPVHLRHRTTTSTSPTTPAAPGRASATRSRRAGSRSS